MNFILECFIALISGAIYEAACVGWVHYSEKEKPTITAGFSMLIALCQVIGIGESIHDIRTTTFSLSVMV